MIAACAARTESPVITNVKYEYSYSCTKENNIQDQFFHRDEIVRVTADPFSLFYLYHEDPSLCCVSSSRLLSACLVSALTSSLCAE